VSIADKREAYEQSALKQLFEQSGHTICQRCYCCDMVCEWAPCWQCGGFEPEPDDDFLDVCSVCDGAGKIYFQRCIGNCDDEGNHVNPLTPLHTG
jgi:hypothetical protein